MEITAEQKLYAINLDWFEKNQTSFSTVAGKRLCPACQKKLTPENKENPEKLIQLISECCAKEKNYIHPQQPIIESLFRLFLSNNNKPLKAEEIVEKVNERRAENPLSISVETLQRLLDNTRFLGLGPVSPQS